MPAENDAAHWLRPASALFAPASASTMPNRPLEQKPDFWHIDAGDGESSAAVMAGGQS